jgi:hypothetical protein
MRMLEFVNLASICFMMNRSFLNEMSSVDGNRPKEQFVVWLERAVTNNSTSKIL